MTLTFHSSAGGHYVELDDVFEWGCCVVLFQLPMVMTIKALAKIGYGGWTAAADAGRAASYPTFARCQPLITSALILYLALKYHIFKAKSYTSKEKTTKYN